MTRGKRVKKICGWETLTKVPKDSMKVPKLVFTVKIRTRTTKITKNCLESKVKSQMRNNNTIMSQFTSIMLIENLSNSLSKKLFPNSNQIREAKMNPIWQIQSNHLSTILKLKILMKNKMALRMMLNATILMFVIAKAN